MACVVCQHCQYPVLKEESVAIRDGYSYHKKCHKCYVCSETNLHDAEMFQGVLFCCSCSQRIFQGCSTARKTKNGNRDKNSRSKSKAKRRERAKNVRAEKIKGHANILELARRTASTDSEGHDLAKILPLSDILAKSEFAIPEGEKLHENRLRKNSAEIGMTTEVTQALLKQMNCPVISQKKLGCQLISPENELKKNIGSRFNKTVICSDLRIAELGASTEIAHMALRKHSEVPVIIQSRSIKAMESLTLSGNQESYSSAEGNEEWLDSSYSIKAGEDSRWLDKRLGSFLKSPYSCFKKNILNRSSKITELMISEKGSHKRIKNIKTLFREEITQHQQRGVKRLYSTINRRRTPYKLGWLNLIAKVSAGMFPELTKEYNDEAKRCKHFHRSHSYRCMRAHVMKLAGPTKSELACFRSKVVKILTPSFVKNVMSYNKKYTAIMMSQACGSDKLII